MYNFLVIVRNVKISVLWNKNQQSENESYKVKMENDR
jgi:hypothetical protein